MFAKSLIALALLASCSSPAPTPVGPTAPIPADPVQKQDDPGIGEKCGSGDACGGQAQCISYYGIAGANGPQFKTCEVRCEDDGVCPAGRKCNTIADGPGRVCR